MIAITEERVMAKLRVMEMGIGTLNQDVDDMKAKKDTREFNLDTSESMDAKKFQEMFKSSSVETDQQMEEIQMIARESERVVNKNQKRERNNRK